MDDRLNKPVLFTALGLVFLLAFVYGSNDLIEFQKIATKERMHLSEKNQIENALNYPVNRSKGDIVDKIQVAFIENKGQFDKDVAFALHKNAMQVFFTQNSIVLRLNKRNLGQSPNYTGIQHETVMDEEGENSGANVFMTFENASPDVMIEGTDLLSGRYHFIRGNNESQSVSNVSLYGSIRYKGLYPGVDMVVRSGSGQLEYDLILEPGADADSIVVRCEGGEGLQMDETNSLVLHTAVGPFVQPMPYTYSIDTDGNQEQQLCSYRILGEDRFGFHVPEWNHELALVIDPELVFGTYLGGDDKDTGISIAVDESGAIFVTGYTYSMDFPTTPGAFDPSSNNNSDVFVFKLSPDGSELLFSTFIGGSSWDQSWAIITDDSGAPIIAGLTGSPNFPTTLDAYDSSRDGPQDAFVAKLSPDGSTLLYGTYVGGSDVDSAWDLLLNETGEIYITGSTRSSDFPTTPGAYDTFYGANLDAFLVKLSADGSSLVLGTYLGGWYDDYANSLALDTNGNILILGSTYSNNFPVSQNAFDTTLGGDKDGFALKLSADGSNMIFSTFLGGEDDDSGRYMVVDDSGGVIISGTTYSFDFPVTQDAYDTSFNGSSDCFLIKLNSDGTDLVFSTFIGGAGIDGLSEGLALDPMGSVIVAGVTTSLDFPTTPGAYDTSFNDPNGYYDVYISKLSADGSTLLYSTFLGGDGTDFLYSFARDVHGMVVVTGFTEAANFPTTQNAFDPTWNGDEDIFVAKLGLSLSADVYQIPEIEPKNIEFMLTAGVDSAFQKYLIVPGVSGTAPGMPLGGNSGLVLPVNWDFVSDLMLSLNNIANFFGFLGILDANGNAMARFEWPGYPGSAGISLYFTYCCKDPANGFDFVSNVVEIQVVP